jgi:hypothetical protein
MYTAVMIACAPSYTGDDDEVYYCGIFDDLNKPPEKLLKDIRENLFLVNGRGYLFDEQEQIGSLVCRSNDRSETHSQYGKVRAFWRSVYWELNSGEVIPIADVKLYFSGSFHHNTAQFIAWENV